MDAAEELYERIKKEGYSAIQNMLGEQEEHLHLDFIRKTDPSKAELGKDDKRNYSKALSGFANSSGGVIVWGIECSKSQGKPDVASQIQPITDLKQFITNLNSITGELVSPIVENVLNNDVENPDAANTGVGLTLVPESDSCPHMASDNRYYKRSGDSFYRMEHFDVEDMFGRRKKPKLKLTCSIRRGSVLNGSQGKHVQIVMQIFIENNGRAIAKYPHVFIHKLSGNYGVMEREYDMFPLGRQWNKYAGGIKTAVIPGLPLLVTERAIRLSAKTDEIPDFTADYTIGAEDFPAVSGTLMISGSEILKQVGLPESN